jgi:hypothetical protein
VRRKATGGARRRCGILICGWPASLVNELFTGFPYYGAWGDVEPPLWRHIMSISAIFTAQSSYQPSSSQSTFAQDFRQLVGSLNSGDLSGAQQAYSALSQLQSSGQGPSANPNNPISQVLSQIGQALQNGSLSGAQQALSSLQQSHSGHHSHGHHHGSGDSATTSSSAAATTGFSTVSGANAVNITA